MYGFHFSVCVCVLILKSVLEEKCSKITLSGSEAYRSHKFPELDSRSVVTYLYRVDCREHDDSVTLRGTITELHFRQTGSSDGNTVDLLRDGHQTASCLGRLDQLQKSL
jgi:hypothetical protein